MKPTPKQLHQRREMAAQKFNDGRIHNARKQFNTEFRVRKPANPTGHANIGTDEDVRAYCARMGYAYEVRRFLVIVAALLGGCDCEPPKEVTECVKSHFESTIRTGYTCMPGVNLSGKNSVCGIRTYLDHELVCDAKVTRHNPGWDAWNDRHRNDKKS